MNCCCQLANPAWYPQPTIAATDIQESVGLATSCNESSTNRVSSCTRTRLVRRRKDYITYLLPLVTNIPSPSSRRASSNGDLFQPRNERRTGDRAFSVAAARAWNRLSTTETRSVVNSNIQAPSEVLPFSHRVLTM